MSKLKCIIYTLINLYTDKNTAIDAKKDWIFAAARNDGVLRQGLKM